MFEVRISDEILEKFRDILADEEEGTCVRLRLYNSGKG